jgi:hypothetical protein
MTVMMSPRLLRVLLRCAPGAARPLYGGSALDSQPAREITRRQAETQELWRNWFSRATCLHTIAWSAVAAQPAPQRHGGAATPVGAPRPRRCRPAAQKSALLTRRVAAAGEHLADGNRPDAAAWLLERDERGVEQLGQVRQLAGEDEVVQASDGFERIFAGECGCPDVLVSGRMFQVGQPEPPRTETDRTSM